MKATRSFSHVLAISAALALVLLPYQEAWGNKYGVRARAHNMCVKKLNAKGYHNTQTFQPVMVRSGQYAWYKIWLQPGPIYIVGANKSKDVSSPIWVGVFKAGARTAFVSSPEPDGSNAPFTKPFKIKRPGYYYVGVYTWETDPNGGWIISTLGSKFQ